jgi:hypothetical protein
MKDRPGERGSVKGLLLLLVFAAMVFVGISFGKPYYRSYTLGSHTRNHLKTDIGDVATIKKNIMKDAEELKVPLDEADLDVVLVNKVIKVRATWSETVDFWGYYQKQFDFVMEEEF